MRRMRLQRLLICSVVFCSPAMLPAAGAWAELQGPIDLDTAVARALERNPKLAVAAYRREAGEGRRLQAGLSPNPEVDLQVENLLGSGIYSGLDGAETTLSVVWVLERGKRSHRIAAADAGLGLADAEARLTTLEVASDTALRFLTVLVDQERFDQARRGVALAERTVAVVEHRVEAGRAPAADLAKAESDLAWSRLTEEDVEHELLVSRRWLTASWGVDGIDFSEATGDVFRLPEPGTYPELMRRLETSPLMNRFLTEARVRQAELSLAEAEAKPDWRVSAGVRHLALADEGALVAGINVPLTSRNRNQGRIAEATARVAMADSERMAARVEIEAVLFGLHQELLHNVHRSESIRTDVLPRLERVLAEAERAYGLGRYGYNELRIAQRELLQVRAVLLEESRQAHSNLIEIERLTGRPVATQEETES
jgi:cobalt-zinc-cadmium efflux system outer membrane protein